MATAGTQNANAASEPTSFLQLDCIVVLPLFLTISRASSQSPVKGGADAQKLTFYTLCTIWTQRFDATDRAAPHGGNDTSRRAEGVAAY